jgi:hypothetical protein
MLVVIGKGLHGLNENKCAHLPSGWRTHYCIARLGQTRIGGLIAQGRIHPRSRLREASELLAEFRPELTQRKTTLSPVNRRLIRFSNFVRTHAVSLSSSDRQLVHAGLKRLLNAVSSKSNASFTYPNP